MTEALAVVGFLIKFLLFAVCTSKTVYRTIDDTRGDEITGITPIYSPSSVWDDNTCTKSKGCSIVPDRRYAYEGTWTAATYFPTRPGKISITLQFEGTGIVVYFIVTNDLDPIGIAGNTECNFTLDGTLVSRYKYQDTSLTGLIYNQEVLSVQGLANTSHALEMSVGEQQLDRKIYVNFDYANYTVEVPDDAEASELGSGKNSDTGAIIGGAVGGSVSVILLAVVGWLLYRQSRKRRAMVEPETNEPKEQIPPPGSVTPFVPYPLSSSETSRSTSSKTQSRMQPPTPIFQPRPVQAELHDQIQELREQMSLMRDHHSRTTSPPPPDYMSAPPVR